MSVYPGSLLLEHQSWRGRTRQELPNGHTESQALFWGLLVPRPAVSLMALVWLRMYFYHVPNKREPCGSICERVPLPNILGDFPCLQHWPHHKSQIQLNPYQVGCEKILPLIFLYMPFLLETLGLVWGAF